MPLLPDQRASHPEKNNALRWPGGFHQVLTPLNGTSAKGLEPRLMRMAGGASSTKAEGARQDES